MSMVRYSRKELNEKFSDKQDAEIERLLAKGTVPDDQLDLSEIPEITDWSNACLLYTSPSPRDVEESRMPSSA